MVSKSARRIKLSINLKPFVSRVQRAGRVQIAFKDQIGIPAGQCVASKVRPGMSSKAIHDAARECTRQYRGTRLSLPAPGVRVAAAARGEFFEVA